MTYYIKERKVYVNGMPEFEFYIQDDTDSRQGPLCMFFGKRYEETARVYCNWLNGNVLTVIPAKEELSDPPRKAKVSCGVINK